jgi:hypothetical protein
MNISAFLGEWWRLILWGEGVEGRAKAAWSYFLAILALLGVPGSVVMAFFDDLRPYAVLLSLPACAYLAWQGGRAWQNTRGPIIWIGKVTPDKYQRLWEVRVENRGNEEVTPHAYVTDLLDRSGNRIPRIDHGSLFKAHWRGQQGEVDKIKLGGEKHLYAAILAVDKIDPAGPLQLVMWVPDGKVSLLPGPLASKQNEVLYLDIRVDFCDDKGATLRTKTRRYQVTPDTTSELGFQVCEKSWHHSWERGTAGPPGTVVALPGANPQGTKPQ